MQELYKITESNNGTWNLLENGNQNIRDIHA